MDNNTVQQFDQNDINATKGLAWLSYFGIFFLIPMLCNKDSAYTKFHVNQGIMLFILEVAGGIVMGILTAILGFMGVAGALIGLLILWAFYIFVFVLAIWGIINAATGKTKALPILGKAHFVK